MLSEVLSEIAVSVAWRYTLSCCASSYNVLIFDVIFIGYYSNIYSKLIFDLTNDLNVLSVKFTFMQQNIISVN